MPQSNLYTFLSQSTWTIIIFYVLYYLIKQYILPIILENIKIQKYLSTSKNNTELSNKSSNQQHTLLYFINKYNF